MDDLIKKFTDSIFDEAEEMQKEMHILIEAILKTERGKNMSYDDVKTVYFLYKIAEVIKCFDHPVMIDAYELEKKKNQEELRKKNDDLRIEHSISFEDLIKPLKPTNKKWWQIF